MEMLPEIKDVLKLSNHVDTMHYKARRPRVDFKFFRRY